MNRTGITWRRVGLVLAITVCGVLADPSLRAAQAPEPATGVRLPQLSETDVRTWLTYLSSDLLQGRQVFTEGYGLAASYIAGELKAMGVKPLGDEGTYLQAVLRRGYKVTRNSTISVEVAGVTKTFRHGEHVAFAVESGGRQTLTLPHVELVGNAPDGSPAAPSQTVGGSSSGTLVLYFPFATPRATPTAGRRRAGSAATNLMRDRGADAAMGFQRELPPPAAAAPPAPGRAGRSGAAAGADVVTVQRIDRLVPPAITADETVFEWIFSHSSTSFASVRAKAESGQPVTSLTLDDVHVTIDIDNTFEVVSTERTENVVGMVEGTDPKLKSTYVFFGAHLDHVGYSKDGVQTNGRVNTPLSQDPIWNGADDDGTGSTAVLAIAKAFATGPKPKRSVVFVWHAGEEAGLLGSLYMADFPVVPLEQIQVELNIDMIGRNRDNDTGQANTVYVIGADRISTDLHNLLVATNATSSRPLTLDYEFNDLNDPNSFYTRSDHYSYASKGIPIAFFFTGEHPDYHANTDSVDKILFPKMLRIAQFIYQAGFSIANTDRVLERDNLGSRSGKGFKGPLKKTEASDKVSR